MSDRIIDDAYNKLRNDIGTDFSKKNGKIAELYSFVCGNCGYHNIHGIKELDCGCGRKLQGTLVFKKIDDTVIYDARGGKKRKK